MQAESIKECLTFLLNDAPEQAVFIYGPTGCGKTSIIEQVAKEQGAEFVYFNCTAMEPVDLMGKPRSEIVQFDTPTGPVSVECTKYSPPYKLMKALYSKKCIVCLDEVNRLERQMRHAIMPLLDRKEIGDIILPRNALVVMTANPPDEEDYQVEEMDIAMVRRSVTLPFSYDLDALRRYGVFAGFHNRVLAALGRITGLGRKVKHPFEQILTPAGLEMASRLLNAGLMEKLDQEVALQMLIGSCGRDAGMALLASLNDKKLDELLNKLLNKEKVALPDHDVAIALVYMFWQKINKDARKYSDQIKMLYEALNPDIRTLLVQLVYEHMIRYPDAFKGIIEEWTKWCTDRLKAQQERRKKLGMA
jgi:hypothetical protein